MHVGALSRIIVTGECLVHSNHILFLFWGISLLEWQWWPSVDVDGAVAPVEVFGWS